MAKPLIAEAIKKPGALGKQLGAKKGALVPTPKGAAAAKKGGTPGQRGRVAKTLGKLKSGKATF